VWRRGLARRGHVSQNRRVGDWEPAAEASRRTVRARCGKERLATFWIDVSQRAKLWITWGRGRRVRVDRSSRGPLLPTQGLIHSKPLNPSPLGPLLHRVVHRREQGRTSGKVHTVRLWCEWWRSSLAEARRTLGSLRRCAAGFAPGSGRRCGAEAQSRTGDTGLFRAVLYQLSYLGGDMRGRPDLNRRSLE
jgi:hypothetical protein